MFSKSWKKVIVIYSSGKGAGEMPVKDKKERVEALRIAPDQVAEFCWKQNVDPGDKEIF